MFRTEMRQPCYRNGFADSNTNSSNQHNRRHGFRNYRSRNNASHYHSSHYDMGFMYSQDGHTKLDYTKKLDNLIMPKCSVVSRAEFARHKGDAWFPRQKGYSFENIYSRIGFELSKFYDFIRPSRPDYYMRRAIYRSLRDRILKYSPDITNVQFFGSFSSNTHLPISDIDLVLFCKPGVNKHTLLSKIASILLREGLVQKECIFIDRCRVPILKFNDSVTGIPINISANPDHTRLRTNFVRESYQNTKYMSEILACLKYYHAFKEFNEVYHGGISSYSLALMVIYYFSTDHAKNLIYRGGFSNYGTLGRLFIGFLECFSSNSFVDQNIFYVGKDTRACPEEYREEDDDDYYYYGRKSTVFLKIYDDFSNGNFISSGSYRAESILGDFKHFLNSLLAANPNSPGSILGEHFVIPDSLMEYRGTLFRLYAHLFSPYNDKELAIVNFCEHRNEHNRDLNAVICSVRNSEGTLVITRKKATSLSTPNIVQSTSLVSDSCAQSPPLNTNTAVSPVRFATSTPKKRFFYKNYASRSFKKFDEISFRKKDSDEQLLPPSHCHILQILNQLSAAHNEKKL